MIYAGKWSAEKNGIFHLHTAKSLMSEKENDVMKMTIQMRVTLRVIRVVQIKGTFRIEITIAYIQKLGLIEYNQGKQKKYVVKSEGIWKINWKDI